MLKKIMLTFIEYTISITYKDILTLQKFQQKVIE